MESIAIVVPEIPPSNNKYLGKGSRGKNFAYQSEKKRWAELIKYNALSQIKSKDRQEAQQLENVVVEIKYYFKDRRRRDPDNYSGKFILDGLVRAGILKDDSFSEIDLQLVGNIDKENPRTVIIIKPLERTM